MKIYLGADHAGFELKTQLFEHLAHKGIEAEDCGAKTLEENDDYPEYAYAVATKVLGGDDDDRGILICGSGQGMSMAANRINGIRAALAWNPETAEVSKEDDDSNILVIPARFVDAMTAIDMVDHWLDAKFKKDPKYKRRLDELGSIHA